jgi:hypothetical protein
MKNCNCDTGINRDGSGQLQRYLKALDPAYAPIDDRSTEDLLVFAKKYAAQIRFYDIPESKINDNTPAGKISWREFFRRDMAVIAASIATTDAGSFKKEYDEVNERLQYNTTPDVYAALYAPIVGMLKKIDRWYSVAIPQNPLYNDLKLAIESDLKTQVQKIMAYEEGFKFVDPSIDLKIDLDGIENKEAWGLNETVPPEPGIYTGTTQQDKILSASLFTEDIFHAFYNFLNRLISDSGKYMQFAMEQYPAHQPHMALFITFLQLFSKAQQQLNGLTGRLLDFYYKEVLHLETKPSVPDKAHIVFELAKDIVEYGVAAGTALKGGPDVSGKEQVYKTVDDLVINQAKVKELKTIFIDKEDSGAVKNIKAIYARPIGNSADGYGLPFETDTPKWPTFGKGIPAAGKPGNICQYVDIATELLNSKNETRIGFAIASPQLVLRGGNRIIELRIDVSNLKKSKLEIWLSGEDGWLKIEKEINEDKGKIISLLESGGDLSTGMPGESGYFFDELYYAALYICLPVVEKAVVPFNLALHPGRNYVTPYPVMQVMMGPDIEFNPVAFNSITISNLSLSVRVGSVNLPQKAFDITLDGTVIDAATQAPLGGVSIIESFRPGTTNTPVISGADGKFSISTASTRILLFSLKDYKSKVVLVPRTGSIVVKMEQGDPQKEFDFSALIIPSFFDGLKQLALQNDDGLIAADKPFDPFTAYPNFGKSLYIGSDEIFNKPVDELAIHIRHLSDKVDASFDLNYLFFLIGRQKGNTDAFEFYKLSIREQKQWTPLCTPDGDDFVEGLLTHDVLFKKQPDGKIVHLSPLDRNPLLYSTELKDQAIKGFLRLQWNLPITADNDPNEGVTTRKDIFQKMAELALILKVKEISVSYFSRLRALAPETDQFFHVYPFGVAEIYSKPVTSKGARNLLADLLENRSVASAALRKTAPNFQQLDAAKDYLLINAKQRLLPQFTYLSPYDQYEQTTKRISATNTRVKSGDLNDVVVVRSSDAIAEQLILSASGLADKISGGANQYSASIQEEGMLFIGLEKAKPLQMISLLFQFAEGSAADEDNDPPEIHWSYLTNNEWRPLKEENIVSDGTIGFQTTGIIKIEIPQDATNNNTIITGGLHWLCASVTSNSERIPMLINVVTQAVLVNFEDNNNDQSHFDKALPAGSISKLAVAVAQVSKVQQPFASFDGKHEEIGKEFYTRVSERLRHKARAITPWDYEHLVLERFPSIYKVKCISHTDPNCFCRHGKEETKTAASKEYKLEYTMVNGVAVMSEKAEGLFRSAIGEVENNRSVQAAIKVYATKDEEKKMAEFFFRTVMVKNLMKAGMPESAIKFDTPDGKFGEADLMLTGFTGFVTESPCCGPQVAPGHVLLVPISNFKNRNAVNPLQPKTSRRVLLDMEAYIKERTSTFVHVHAKNPVYEQVLVFFRVKFRDGFDKGFHMKKLNDEIVHYLTPWAFDDITEVKFGQKIYASSIINFIEERRYVDFITDFLMIVCRTGCCEEVVNTTTDSKDDEEVLNKISGCADMEILLQDEDDFIGDIVAKPSTARSLLVSAPRHIIIPYTEPSIPSPCQKLVSQKEKAAVLMPKEKIKELIETKEKPEAEIKPVPVSEAPVKEAVASPAAVAVTEKSSDKDKKTKVPVEKKEQAKTGKKNTKAPKKK